MRRATAVRAAGDWPQADEIATVTLAFADRHRRRLRLTDDHGNAFLLDLERAAVLSDGDGLVIEGGGIMRVRAADEAVLDVRCATRAHAVMVAWHLGNRHTPVQVLDDGTLRLADDGVLAAMLAGLGAEVQRRQAPFTPNPGAYAPHRHPGTHGAPA